MICNLTFSEAIILMAAGMRLTRAGWNNKKQYVVKFSPVAHGMEILKVDGHGEYPLCSFMLLRGENMMWSVWTPSTGDTLADDWETYHGE